MFEIYIFFCGYFLTIFWSFLYIQLKVFWGEFAIINLIGEKKFLNFFYLFLPNQSLYVNFFSLILSPFNSFTFEFFLSTKTFLNLIKLFFFSKINSFFLKANILVCSKIEHFCFSFLFTSD